MEKFKCRCCGEKYDYPAMADDEDIGLCKWCGDGEESKKYRESE